jgi:GGDEF domain-containing protein
LIEGRRLNDGASLGVAIYPEDGITRDALLTAADSSMYRAKKAKRSGQPESAQSPGKFSTIHSMLEGTPN